MFFITGLPNSGTTFTANIIASTSGADTSEWYSASSRKGAEWRPLRRYHLGMLEDLVGWVQPYTTGWHLDAVKRRDYLDRCPPPPPAGLVKLPQWGLCNLHEEFDLPTLLVVRPTDGWVRSVRHNRRTMAHIEGLAAEAEEAVERMSAGADLILEWPRAVKDPDYFSGVVGFDVSRAHREITRPDWVTF